MVLKVNAVSQLVRGILTCAAMHQSALFARQQLPRLAPLSRRSHRALVFDVARIVDNWFDAGNSGYPDAPYILSYIEELGGNDDIYERLPTTAEIEPVLAEEIVKHGGQE